MDEGAIIQQFGLWFVVRDGVLREFEPPAYLRTPYYAETAVDWVKTVYVPSLPEPIRGDGANHMKIEKRPAPDLMDAVREIAQGTRRGQ